MKIEKIAKISKTVLIALLLIVAVRLLLTGRRVQTKLNAHAVSDVEQTPYHAPENLAEPTIDYDAVLRADLFGTGENTPDRNVSIPNAQSAQDLKLIGTIAGSPAIARAIIYDAKSQSTKAYRLQDSIHSATIVTIRKDEVVLRDHGRSKILRRSPGETKNIAKSVSPPVPPNPTTVPNNNYKVVP
ncbi:type II secretion system protein N, partial [Planctomycetota bacterium]